MPPDDKVDEDQLLLWLNMGTPGEREEARRVLTNKYLRPLVGVVRGWLGPVPDNVVISQTAAGEALVRLFAKVEEDLGAVESEDRGVWRLLMKMAIDRAKDVVDWLRRHQPDADADDPSERRATQADNPVAQAIGNELLSRVLLFASAIDDEANRVIFMNDLIGERGRLKKKEKHDHDEELLACLEQHGEFTTGALRKRRARLENALEQFLGMNGGGVA